MCYYGILVPGPEAVCLAYGMECILQKKYHNFKRYSPEIGTLSTLHKQ